MKLALAQIHSDCYNLQSNYDKHLRFIQKAVENHVDAIFFPELSLTGYHLENCSKIAMPLEEWDLSEFQNISNQNQITIGLGIPTVLENSKLISMAIIQASQPIACYSKQILHADELPYFNASNYSRMIFAQSKKILPAICYESTLPEHTFNFKNNEVDIYLASVSKPQHSLKKALTHYRDIARTKDWYVMMVNAIGSADSFEAAGQSIVFNRSGEVIHSLTAEEEALLIVDLNQNDNSYSLKP